MPGIQTRLALSGSFQAKRRYKNGNEYARIAKQFHWGGIATTTEASTEIGSSYPAKLWSHVRVTQERRLDSDREATNSTPHILRTHHFPWHYCPLNYQPIEYQKQEPRSHKHCSWPSNLRLYPTLPILCSWQGLKSRQDTNNVPLRQPTSPILRSTLRWCVTRSLASLFLSHLRRQLFSKPHQLLQQQ